MLIYIQTFAFWELLYISKFFDDRRKSIFIEFNEKELTTWSRIMTLCLETIQAVPSRITDYQRPSAPTNPQNNVETLPRLTQGLKEGQIFVSSPKPITSTQKLESTIGSIAKSYGQSPPSRNGTMMGYAAPQMKRISSAASQKLLTDGQQESLSPAGIRESFNTYLTMFLRSRFGYPFRQTFAGRVNTVAFSTLQGYSDVFAIVNAIESLNFLTVASLKDDSYGRVAYDVNKIMTTFLQVLDALQGFVKELPPHWTDIEGTREVEDVTLVDTKLREGLGRMSEAFRDYAVDFRIEGSVLRRAKMAAREG